MSIEFHSLPPEASFPMYRAETNSAVGESLFELFTQHVRSPEELIELIEEEPDNTEETFLDPEGESLLSSDCDGDSDPNR